MSTCIVSDGIIAWLLDGRRHRDDGPAVVHPDGCQQWWREGKLHRDDGPAVVWASGRESWWKNDNRIPPPGGEEEE